MGIIYPTVVVVIYIVTRYMLLVSRVDLQYVLSNSLLVQDSSYVLSIQCFSWSNPHPLQNFSAYYASSTCILPMIRMPKSYLAMRTEQSLLFPISMLLNLAKKINFNVVALGFSRNWKLDKLQAKWEILTVFNSL